MECASDNQVADISNGAVKKYNNVHLGLSAPFYNTCNHCFLLAAVFRTPLSVNERLQLARIKI